METQDHILKYRQKHPRCRYCEFHKWIEPSCVGFWKCLIKDIPLTERLFFWRWQGCFCKWFKVDRKDIERDIEKLEKG